VGGVTVGETSLTDDLLRILKVAAEFALKRGAELSADVLKTLALKATDMGAINAAYHDEITQALIAYFEGGSIAAPKNSFKRATLTAFQDAFDLGYSDGGGELPVDAEANAWLEARTQEEFGNVDALFEQAKELRKDKEFDYPVWVAARADGYTQTLREIYNNGRLRATKDQMVTFDGDDGAESCADCQRLKGKRKKISWFVENNFVPPFGTGLECHSGRRCQHGLMNDAGEWITI
jgi:hypothetical protein